MTMTNDDEGGSHDDDGGGGGAVCRTAPLNGPIVHPPDSG